METLLRLSDQTIPGSFDIGIKKEVRVASGANVDVLTGGLISVDGVTVVSGDRVLLYGQTVGSENGIWVAAAGAWARALDANETAEVFPGEIVPVGPDGTSNANSLWLNSTPAPIVVGTTAQSFQMISALGAILLARYKVGESLTGTVDGSNVNFSLPTTPELGTLQLYKNGLRLFETNDYSISGANITLVKAPKSTPGQTDVLRADYISTI